MMLRLPTPYMEARHWTTRQVGLWGCFRQTRNGCDCDSHSFCLQDSSFQIYWGETYSSSYGAFGYSTGQFLEVNTTYMSFSKSLLYNSTMWPYLETYQPSCQKYVVPTTSFRFSIYIIADNVRLILFVQCGLNRLQEGRGYYLARLIPLEQWGPSRSRFSPQTPFHGINCLIILYNLFSRAKVVMFRSYQISFLCLRVDFTSLQKPRLTETIANRPTTAIHIALVPIMLVRVSVYCLLPSRLLRMWNKSFFCFSRKSIQLFRYSLSEWFGNRDSSINQIPDSSLNIESIGVLTRFLTQNPQQFAQGANLLMTVQVNGKATGSRLCVVVLEQIIQSDSTVWTKNWQLAIFMGLNSTLYLDWQSRCSQKHLTLLAGIVMVNSIDKASGIRMERSRTLIVKQYGMEHQVFHVQKLNLEWQRQDPGRFGWVK